MEPGGEAFLRSPTVRFADTAMIRDRYHGISASTLGACIGDGTIPPPVV
jgi:hypothetical protein